MPHPQILQGRLFDDDGAPPFVLLMGTPDPAETTPIYGVQGLSDDGSLDEVLDLRGSCY